MDTLYISEILPIWYISNIIIIRQYDSYQLIHISMLLHLSSSGQYIRQSVFMLRHFGHFLLKSFGQWNISVICLTLVLKLAITVFFSPYLQTFWANWLKYFQSFQNHFGLWLENDRKKAGNARWKFLQERCAIAVIKYFST